MVRYKLSHTLHLNPSNDVQDNWYLVFNVLNQQVTYNGMKLVQTSFYCMRMDICDFSCS